MLMHFMSAVSWITTRMLQSTIVYAYKFLTNYFNNIVACHVDMLAVKQVEHPHLEVAIGELARCVYKMSVYLV